MSQDPRAIRARMAYRERVRGIHGDLIVPVDEYIDVSTPIEHECSRCGSRWSASPSNILHGTRPSGCPECSHGSRRITDAAIRKELRDLGIELIGEYSGRAIKTDLRCMNCSWEWSAVPRPGNTGCPKCAGRRRGRALKRGMRSFRDEYGTHWPDVKVSGIYRSQETRLFFRCPKGHQWMRRAIHALVLSRNGTGGCPQCHAIEYGNCSKVSLDCISAISRKTRLRFMTAPSGGEYRVPGTPYRLDGYNKRHNIGIEFHGDYFHGYRDKRTKPYRDTIKRDAELAGIVNLFVVWEHEWISDPKAVVDAAFGFVDSVRRSIRAQHD